MPFSILFFVFFVCSSCVTPSRNPSPNPQASVWPQNKPTPRHLRVPTTTVGAHRGAVMALAGLISDGIFVINAGTHHRHCPRARARHHRQIRGVKSDSGTRLRHRPRMLTHFRVGYSANPSCSGILRCSGIRIYLAIRIKFR